MQLVVDLFNFTFRVLAILGAAALILFLLLLDFMSRSNDHVRHDELPPTAVVFTGNFDRIHLGLELLSAGNLERVFISGVNGPAGLNVDRFPEQFELTSEQADWIKSGKILLAPDALSTLENALEAACWLEHQPDVEAVTLITSRGHMARASLALERTIAPISVVRVVSGASKEYDKYQIDLVEFGKFTATWIIMLLPDDLWPADKPATCSDN